MERCSRDQIRSDQNPGLYAPGNLLVFVEQHRVGIVPKNKSVKYPFRADTEFKNKILHLVELDLGEKKSCCTHPST